MRGTLKWFNIGKGFGFIEPTDGSGSCFLHLTKVAREDQQFLVPGIVIEFTPQETAKGRAAVSARIVRDANGRDMKTDNHLTPSEVE
jgi:cold shock CspA family protein